jgi:hypothetical protein
MSSTGEQLRASDARMIDLAFDNQERIFPELEPGESGAIAAYKVGRMAVRGHVYFSAWDETEPETDERAQVTVCNLDNKYEGMSNMLAVEDLKAVANQIGLDIIDEELFVEADDLDVFLRRMIASSLIYLHSRFKGVM